MADAAGLRTVVNWVTLATPLGLLIAAATGCRSRPGPRGLTYAVGHRHGFPRGAGITVGSVVILRDERLLARPRLLAHEERHATQWAACLGIVGFPILYAGSSAWSWLVTGDAHSRNCFERRAGLADGGYHERPLRWQRSRAL